MLSDITLGQYYPVESKIHALDPRTKLFATMMFMVAIFVMNQLWAYGVCFLVLIYINHMAGIPIKYLLKGIKPLIWIILFTFVINIFFIKGGSVVLKFGFLSITTTGIKTAVFMAIRLILLVMGTSVLTLTTSPIELTDGIEKAFSPLKKIGFPAHELAMMMTIALRFIPTLLDETDKIMKAQMSRGADFESRNIINRAKNMVPLLVPLFISALRRADELAMAMEARCYRGGKNRTKMKEGKYTIQDRIGYICSIGLVLFSIASRWINLI